MANFVAMIFNFEFTEVAEINKWLSEQRNAINLNTDKGMDKVIRINKLIELTSNELKRIASEIPRTYDNQTGNYASR